MADEKHGLLIAALCGPIPPEMIAGAQFRASYFDPDGAVRFHPKVRRVSLRERLRRNSKLTGPALDCSNHG